MSLFVLVRPRRVHVWRRLALPGKSVVATSRCITCVIVVSVYHGPWHESVRAAFYEYIRLQCIPTLYTRINFVVLSKMSYVCTMILSLRLVTLHVPDVASEMADEQRFLPLCWLLSSSRPRAPWSEDFATAAQASSGALSHIVHVTAGGVNTRPYKGSPHVPSDNYGVECHRRVLRRRSSPQTGSSSRPLHPDAATPGGQTLHPAALTVRHGCGEHAPWSAAGKDPVHGCGDDDTHVATVAAVFVHPCWAGPTPLGDHDVALLRLVSPGIPAHASSQHYATLDDGSRLTSPGPKLDGTGGSGGAAAAGTELLFRGFGPTDPKGTVSAALREATVTVSDGARCVEKFLIDDHTNAGVGASEVAPSATSPASNASTPAGSSGTDPLGASTALILHKPICVGGGDGLSPAALRGGCPNGDEGGPLTDPKTGVLVGLWSRLTPPVSLVARHDLEHPDTSDHMLDDPTKSYCGGAGRGRFYDVFVRISYYKGWIETTMRNRYDGGVCSASRILDSDLRCPPGAWGDAEGHDPLLGLLGNGGALSSLASATAMAETEAARALEATATGSSPFTLTHHTAPTLATSAVCRLCPPGRYGARSGLETSDCSGVCEAGYFCPAGSVSPRQEPCTDVAFHCPEGTAEPRKTVAGYVSVPNSTHFNPNLEALTDEHSDYLKLDPSLSASLRHGDTFARPTEYRKACQPVGI